MPRRLGRWRRRRARRVAPSSPTLLAHLVDEPRENASHGRLLDQTGAEAAEPNAELRRRRLRLQPDRVPEWFLEEHAVDGEEQIVDPVERQLEARGDPAEHQPSDVPEPHARWKLDGCPVGGLGRAHALPFARAERVVAIGVDREDAVEQA